MDGLWSGMANVCYYCKLNNMLMCEIMLYMWDKNENNYMH